MLARKLGAARVGSGTLQPVIALLAVLLVGCATSRDELRYDSIVADLVVPAPVDEASAPAPSLPPLPAGPLALEEAIGLALERNPDHLAVAMRVRQAAYWVAEAAASMHPQIDVGLGYFVGNAPGQVFFRRVDSRTFSPELDVNDAPTEDYFEPFASLSYTVYDGGMRQLQRWQAESGRALREVEESVARNALTASVIDAFFTVLAASEAVESAQVSRATIEAELTDRRKKYEAGSALRSDVLSLEVRVLEASERLIRAQNGGLLALAALANLLGADADSELEIEEPSSYSVDLPVDYSSALELGLARRAEIRGAQLKVENAAMGVAMNRAERGPRLDAMGRLYLTDSDLDLDLDDTNWWLQLNLTWKAWDGGARKARAGRSRAIFEEALLADRQATLRIQLDIKSAYLRIAEAKARLEVAEAALGHAEASLDIVRTQYEAGAADITRFLVAEEMLAAARLSRVRATYDLRASLADAKRSIGGFAGVPENPSSRRSQ